MSVDFGKLLRSNTGRILISIILGLGLASLFRKECKSDECLDFKGPNDEDIKNKLFRFDNKCYYVDVEPEAAECDTSKTIVNLK